MKEVNKWKQNKLLLKKQYYYYDGGNDLLNR